jgi:hypothetical protein
MKLHTVVATAFVLNAGVVSVYGVDRMSESDQGPSTGPLIAQMGTPEPGSVSDQETTRKQRNPAKAQGTDQNTQVTLGGAKNVVTGEVFKIDGEYHFIKEDSGEEVRLLVNKDTRKICGSGTASASSSSPVIGKQDGSGDPAASDEQIRQGQRKDETATGSGFQMGQSAGCAFKAGDRIKAEVSDIGTVTTIRYLAEAKRSARASQLPLPDESKGEGMQEAEDRPPSIETLMTEKAKAIAPADLHPEGSGEQTASAPARSAPEEQVKGEVIRGKIVTIQNEFLAVKTTNGKDVRLHVDKNTHRGQVNLKDEEFKEGDKIEAYVTQKGHAISISLMRHRGICPGTPKEGDDMDLML